MFIMGKWLRFTKIQYIINCVLKRMFTFPAIYSRWRPYEEKSSLQEATVGGTHVGDRGKIRNLVDTTIDFGNVLSARIEVTPTNKKRLEKSSEKQI